jgi:hypothetical protein
MFSRARSITSRTRAGVTVIAILVVLALWYRPPFAQLVPPLAAPPLASPDTGSSSPAGQTIFLRSGDDLQAAIDKAQPGDILTLQAGATFTGNFVLRNKAGSDWIVIRPSEPDGELPSPGTRVAPSDSVLLPKIVTPNALPAIVTEAAAHHFHFVGIEITSADSGTGAAPENLVRLESPARQESPSQVPTDIIFDRCYIHGTPTGQVRRGIALNSARTAVVDSYLADFHRTGADSQAIIGWNGPGPFKIVNNHLEAAGENLVFGGADPAIPDLVPSDIEVRGNYFYKPLSWRPGDPSYAGRRWTVKSLLALKNAQRAVIEDNVFEHNWSEARDGFAILFTVRNANGAAPWSVVQDITFRKNILRQSGAGLGILGRDDEFPSQQTKRILIQDNLFEDISGANWGGSGVLFQIAGGSANVVIDHNTGFQNGSAIVADGAPNTGFVYQNNIARAGDSAAATSGARDVALGARFPGTSFSRNVLTGANPARYPADNFFPAAVGDIGFWNPAAGDYRLLPTSPYFNGGTDGAHVGADFDALMSSTAGVIDGKRNWYAAKRRSENFHAG